MTSMLAQQPPAHLGGDFSAQIRLPPGLDLSKQLLEPREAMNVQPQTQKRYNDHNFLEGLETNDDPSELSPTEGGDGNSSATEGPSRKRRRSRKGLDKKFKCPQEGCGKSYSRAEHLYRHQLNHTPKQIFSCGYPGCTRTFVRGDLCIRHKDRHTAKGSQLHRRDTTLGHQSPIRDVGNSTTFHVSTSAEDVSQVTGLDSRPMAVQYHPTTSDMDPNAFALVTNHGSTNFGREQPHGLDNFLGADTFKRPDSDNFGRHHEQLITGIPLRPQNPNFGVSDVKPADLPQGSAHNARFTSPSGHAMYANSLLHPQNYMTQHNFATFPLQSPGFPNSSTATPHNPETENYSSGVPVDFMKEHTQSQQSGSELALFEEMAESITMPVFGCEKYNRSPFAIPEDLVDYLFNGQQLEPPSPGAQPGPTSYSDVPNLPTFLGMDSGLDGFYPANSQNLHRHMAVTTLLDNTISDSRLSEEKSQAIVDMIKERFNENGYTLTAKQKDSILEGDRNVDQHIMSRNMMQFYIGSYWYHFSEQMPILHRPTFVPDDTPKLLLVAMMAIGAACLPSKHGIDVSQPGIELPSFLAWHLRTEIFNQNEFRPPAKLWVFQALLLLEIYEKIFATRVLHERAHIHHATTITLMRRGSSFIGRPSLDSPPSTICDRSGVNSSRRSSASAPVTPSEWWDRWVTNEATRRAAFAAFVIDSTHATMFGHSIVMVAHEMRLPLPCDDTLWYATNSAEVCRLEVKLHASGVKPISFLEGLKRTLNAQEVRTGAFGRTILMAGLLSVSWHMNQRDLQVNSLGVSHPLGGRDKWRGSLTRAFDLWKQDFDRSLVRQADSIPGPYLFPERKSEAAAFQSRIVLHHLAHMAMHVDIVDCQIYARAKRLLGRSIGPEDLHSAQRRMQRNWVHTAKARDATWYALRFLRTVLLPIDGLPTTMNTNSPRTALEYSARDDFLLNRPWVMYFAALIVWSYGYAKEGPTTAPLPTSYDFEDQVRDMRSYLRRLGDAGSPEELKCLRGFNGCSGLLMVLRSLFEKTRWELLHEAALLLGNCIHLIKGAI